MGQKKDKGNEEGFRKWIGFTLFPLAFAILVFHTIPSFQEERRAAGKLREQRAYRKRLENLRNRYAVKAKALLQDPQEEMDLYLKLKAQGLVK